MRRHWGIRHRDPHIRTEAELIRMLVAQPDADEMIRKRNPWEPSLPEVKSWNNRINGR